MARIHFLTPEAFFITLKLKSLIHSKYVANSIYWLVDRDFRVHDFVDHDTAWQRGRFGWRFRWDGRTKCVRNQSGRHVHKDHHSNRIDLVFVLYYRAYLYAGKMGR